MNFLIRKQSWGLFGAGIQTFLFFKESFKQQFLYQNTGTVPFFIPFLTARADTLLFLIQFLLHTQNACIYRCKNQPLNHQLGLVYSKLILLYFTALLHYLVFYYYNIYLIL